MMLSDFMVAPLSAGNGNWDARNRTRNPVASTRRLRDPRVVVLARPLFADDKFHRFHQDAEVQRQRVTLHVL